MIPHACLHAALTLLQAVEHIDRKWPQVEPHKLYMLFQEQALLPVRLRISNIQSSRGYTPSSAASCLPRVPCPLGPLQDQTQPLSPAVAAVAHLTRTFSAMSSRSCAGAPGSTDFSDSIALNDAKGDDSPAALLCIRPNSYPAVSNNGTLCEDAPSGRQYTIRKAVHHPEGGTPSPIDQSTLHMGFTTCCPQP